MQGTKSIQFNISIGLIKHLRSFTHSEHKYPVQFVTKILQYLKKLCPQLAEAQCSYPTDIAYKTIAYPLVVHYGLALTQNIEKFFEKNGVDTELISNFPQLNIKSLNSTNIFNSLTLYSNIMKVYDPEEEILADEEVDSLISVNIDEGSSKEYYDIKIKTGKNGQGAVVTIPSDMIIVELNSCGRYLPYFLSHLSHKINDFYEDIRLYPYIFEQIDSEYFTTNLSQQAPGVLDYHLKAQVDEYKYMQYVSQIVHCESIGQLKNTILKDIEEDLCLSLFTRDTRNMRYIEKLLISLVGHYEVEIRDQAIILLNSLYDGIDWQMRGPYKTRITSCGKEFQLEVLLTEQSNDGNLFVLLNCFSFDTESNTSIISYHKPLITTIQDSEKTSNNYQYLVLNFGKFPRCGFYDWKIVKLDKNGKFASVYLGNEDKSRSQLDLSVANTKLYITRPLQGRIVVQPSFAKELQVHEVFVDLEDSVFDAEGKLTKVGSFQKVREELNQYKSSGINCLYLMGALERDNGKTVDPQTKQVYYKRVEANPLSVTSREQPCEMLGGTKEFSQLIRHSKDIDIKIIIDCIARVSSSRSHRKYLEHLVYTLDDKGKKVICYGTDGRSLNYDDTALLNYRKKEVWDLLIQEIVKLAGVYCIDGIHLDNGQAWPNIMQVDQEELYRSDPDGQIAYTDEQIFTGNVVIPEETSGFWHSNVRDKHSNPFLIKLCKELWKLYPNFIIIAETWGGPGFEDREIPLVKSGVIPRMFNLPVALSSIYGQTLHRDGQITSCERKSVNALRSWYEGARKRLPDGSILIQSTTTHSWPYPALLYKRGAWSAIDLFFFLPDIPMTFIGEQKGCAYRLKTTNIFQKEVQTDIPIIITQPQQQQQQQYLSITSTSTTKRDYQNVIDEKNEYGSNTLQRKQTGFRNQLKIKSASSLSNLESLVQIKNAEDNLKRELGPEFGFDLNKIGKHYEHRRRLRHQHDVFRYGKLLPMYAEHDSGLHSHVLAFARYFENQIAIIAINFNEGPVQLRLNLKNLKVAFDDYFTQKNIVVKVVDLLSEKIVDYFSPYELCNERHEASLNPHSSLVWLGYLEDCPKYDYSHSVRRLQSKIKTGQLIEGNEITKMIQKTIIESKSVQQFANRLSYITENILYPNNLSLYQSINRMKEVKNDPSVSSKLFAYCKSILDDNTVELDSVPYKAVNDITQQNKLGTIVFITPELGKFSTVGGLGVMVDELSQGLAELGEDVIMISPFYERNRIGETDYLKKDNIHHMKNIDIFLGDGKYVLGIHKGFINGVQLYFLHNPDFFPTPYADGDAAFTVRQMALIAKGSLELLCQIRKIPTLILTNDWFTGFVPAYNRSKSFGDVFKGTIFFHIAHNLESTYEGRLWPQPSEGTLEHIYQFPAELVMDPYWKDKVINPSRCAILCSDQWGTVSNSYKQDLLNNSPLSSILRRHPSPFGFANGIPKQIRIERIKKECGSLEGAYLFAKEKLQQTYFKYQQMDEKIALFSFVGRVTQQKGVHLILESAEQLLKKYNFKIQFLVGGPASGKDPYAGYCRGLMFDLLNKYPHNFWAAPDDFFTNGTLVNAGSDFGMMPSLFEPGGIVQHEFFIGSTPVIAFKTGGLKDSVVEFNQKTLKGNGFTFEDHRVGDFMYAVDRAMSVYQNKQKYAILRQNAFESCLDVEEVSRAWDKEFYRLQNKIFVDQPLVQEHLKRIHQNFDSKNYEPEDPSEIVINPSKEDIIKSKIRKLMGEIKENKLKQCTFTYKTSRLPKPKIVQVCGIFHNWDIKKAITLVHNYITNTWSCTIQLPPGEYIYKYIVDGEWVISEDDLTTNDVENNLNNYIIVK